MTATPDLNVVRDRLAKWFEHQLPRATQIEVSPLKTPGAGSSNETYFFHLDRVEDGRKISQDLVIRWPPSGFLVFPEHSYDMGQQYRLLKGLMDSQVPSPPVHWLEEDPSAIGMPFYIMERVSGWVPGDFPPYHMEGPIFEATDEGKSKIWLNAIDAMIAVHELDWEAAGLDFLKAPTGTGFIESQIDYYDATHDQNGAPMAPVLAATRDWLMDNRFTPQRHTLCWGDARLGNMVFSDTDVAAALDWEMACIGDPESDLAWFAHIDWSSSAGRSSGAIERGAGLPSIEDTIAYYERKTGRKAANLHYYDVFAAYRLAIVYTRMEHDERYLARSGGAKGLLTRAQFGKLSRLIGFDG